MPRSFKATVAFTLFFWALFLGGVYAVNWCDFSEAASLVLFAGPVALVGSISSFIEWHVWRKDV